MICTGRAPCSDENGRASLLTAKTSGIFCGISCYRGVCSPCRAQALDQQGHAARRDCTRDLVIRHAGAHPAEHAADAHRDIATLFGDRNDVALRFAFEAKAWPSIVQTHLLLFISYML